jgi:hypothetical protein
MIDIREGDILTVSGKDYPVKAVEEWTKANWNTKSFQHMANVSAATKRNPTVDANGKRGTATSSLTGLSITPLDPVDLEVVQRLALDSPVRMLETFIADSTGFVHVIVEDLKQK